VEEAKEHNFAHVNLWWNLPQSHVDFLEPIEIRGLDSTPMLCWFDEHVDKIHWLNVEKYGWC